MKLSNKLVANRLIAWDLHFLALGVQWVVLKFFMHVWDEHFRGRVRKVLCIKHPFRVPSETWPKMFPNEHFHEKDLCSSLINGKHLEYIQIGAPSDIWPKMFRNEHFHEKILNRKKLEHIFPIWEASMTWLKCQFHEQHLSRKTSRLQFSNWASHETCETLYFSKQRQYHITSNAITSLWLNLGFHLIGLQWWWLCY